MFNLDDDFVDDLPDPWNYSPGEKFLHATYRGEYCQVKKYLDQGGDVNVRNTRAQQNSELYGLSALHLALIEEKYHIVPMLVSHIDFDYMTSPQGNTPLHIAASKEKGYEVFNDLINITGAIELVNAKNAENMTPLHLACYYGNVGFVKELCKMPQVDVYDRSPGFTPFVATILRKRLSAFRVLIEDGVDCNRSATPIFNPLHMALQNVCFYMVDKLLDNDVAVVETVQLYLDLGEENEDTPKNHDFPGENLADVALNQCQCRKIDEVFNTVFVAERVVKACPEPPHPDAIFSLYKRFVQLQQRGQNLFIEVMEPKDIFEQMTPPVRWTVCRLLYMSLGRKVSENEYRYLRVKYLLTMDEDYSILIPYQQPNLRLTSAIRARQRCVAESHTKNVLTALRQMENTPVYREHMSLKSFPEILKDEMIKISRQRGFANLPDDVEDMMMSIL